MNEETKLAHDNMLKKLDEFTSAFADVRKEIADFKKEIRNDSKERNEKIDTMFGIYTSGKTSVKVLKGIFYAIVALGSAYLIFKQIIGITFK